MTAERLEEVPSSERVTGPLVAGDLVLDPATGRVHRDRTPVRLTPREYELLHHLMRCKGHVVSRRTLLRAVWDLHQDSAGENVVNVYVGYLRRKIDRPFDRHALRTVRGLGYRIDRDGG